MGFSMVEMGNNRYDILSGKKQIGRVCQHADGSWIGVAGKYIIVRGCHSAKGAFNETVARWLRYDHIPEKKKTKPRTIMPSPKSQIKVPSTLIRTTTPEAFTARSAQMKNFLLQRESKSLE